VFDRDLNFTSNVWQGLFKEFRMNLNFSTAYHAESGRKTERVNRVIEDINVMEKPLKWEDYLNLVEFAYNNGYQESLKMSPFESLHGRKCNTPIRWDNPVDRVVFWPDLLKEMEDQMLKIKQNVKVVQERKKSYVDKKKSQK
jgi:hypothetical protein